MAKNILLAFDSFKGCMSSDEANAVVSSVLQRLQYCHRVRLYTSMYANPVKQEKTNTFRTSYSLSISKCFFIIRSTSSSVRIATVHQFIVQLVVCKRIMHDKSPVPRIVYDRFQISHFFVVVLCTPPTTDVRYNSKSCTTAFVCSVSPMSLR